MVANRGTGVGFRPKGESPRDIRSALTGVTRDPAKAGFLFSRPECFSAAFRGRRVITEDLESSPIIELFCFVTNCTKQDELAMQIGTPFPFKNACK